MILADQHRLDASRAELNAKNDLSAINCFLGIVSIHVHLSGLEVISSNLFFREEISVHSTPSLFRTLLIGDCFFTVRAGGMNGAGVGGSSGGGRGHQIQYCGRFRPVCQASRGGEAPVLVLGPAV
jgi:hypothetical protein